MLSELVRKNRSYRRFNEDRMISLEELKELLELARTSASGANRQPLKFLLSHEEEMNGKIFPLLSWAGYLAEWQGPEKGERPSAYIVILGDHSISDNFFVDHGIAAQTILLGAVEKGLGGCMIAAFENKDLIEELDLHDDLEPLLVIALGEPAEKVVLDSVIDGDIRYFRDEEGIHHVPKRDLEDIVI